jgi:O-antigen/teichoic acid export membrane protein
MAVTSVTEPRPGKAAFYMLPTVVNMALPFATLPIMTRWLTPDDYGVLGLGQVVAGTFAGLAGLGVQVGVQRNFFKYEADPLRLARVMHSGLAVAFGGIFLLGLLLVLYRDRISMLLFGVPDWGALCVAMAATSSLGLLASIHLGYLRNRERARSYMVYEVAGVVGEVGSAVALVTAGFGVWGIVFGALGTKILLVVMLWVRLARELPPGLDMRLAGEVLAVGLPLLPRVLVGSVDNGVDRVLVNWLRSLGQAGLFGIANRVGHSVFAMSTSLENVYIPHVYRLLFREEREAAGRAIGCYLTPYFYASILIAALPVLFLEEALFVLVTPAFYEVKYIGAILATYYGQMFFSKVAGAQLIYVKKTWYATPMAALRLAIHLMFAVLLISHFGVLGAAFSLLATGIVVDSLAFAVAQREYPIRYDFRVVVPLIALLYGCLAWVLIAGLGGAPYGVRLVGKLALLAVLLAYGGQWLRPVVAELRGRWQRSTYTPGHMTPDGQNGAVPIDGGGTRAIRSSALTARGRAEE